MKKILLLLANGFEIYEASVFIDVFGWNKLEGDGNTTLTTAGITKIVNSTFDQKFTVDLLINELIFEEYDALAIPGGFDEFGFYEDAFSGTFTEVIQHFNSRKKTIASICVGALPLAKSKILEGKKATTYHQNSKRVDYLKKQGANFIDSPIVIDQHIITSQNPGTAVGVAFELLETLTSKSNTEKVKKLMGF